MMEKDSSFFDLYNKKELTKTNSFRTIKPSYSLKSVPKVLGEGSYGCVHKPSLRCTRKKYNYNKKISKLMMKNDAEKEMREYNIIKKIDKTQKYYMGVPIKCKFKKSSKNLKAMDQCSERHTFSTNIDHLELLVMENGGLNLDDYSSILLKRPPTRENIEKNHIFWKEVMRILEGLLIFKQSKIIHHDLKPQNIVFDEKKNRLNFIDFGLMTNVNQVLSSSAQSKNRHSSLHWSYPFELFFYNKKNFHLPLKKKEETYESVYFKNKLKTFLFYTERPFSNDFIDEYVEFYIKSIISKLKRIKYKDFIRKSILSIDTYGAGIALIYVFMSSEHLFTHENTKLKMHALFKNMVSPDFTTRYTIEEIIEKYKIIMYEWDAAAATKSQ